MDRSRITSRAEVLSKARALREESRSLRRRSEQLRCEHRQWRQVVRREREAASARATAQPQIPSPWSSLPWQPLAESFDDVLLVVR